jgi:hypothetical protein
MPSSKSLGLDSSFNWNVAIHRLLMLARETFSAGYLRQKKYRCEKGPTFSQESILTIPHNGKMGKRSRQSGENVEVPVNENANVHSKKSILSDEKAVDPSLALLFASSVSSWRMKFYM